MRTLGLAATLAAPLAACTQAQTTGQSPAYLIIDSLAGAPGAEPEEFRGVLASDVVTNVKTQVDINGETQTVAVPTIFADNGRAVFRLALKDPGSVDSPNRPSSANFITLNRYRVQYVRADGRNTPGVDVPYPFDGAITATVADNGATAQFTVVRVQAKQESPLLPLTLGGGANTISAMAEITFFGADQAGRPVNVTGTLGVDFSDWGDPE
jgi:hypothetical protein